MTQKELAALFGVTRETIYRIEGGKRGDRTTKYGVLLLRERMRIWAEMHKPAEKETPRLPELSARVQIAKQDSPCHR